MHTGRNSSDRAAEARQHFDQARAHQERNELESALRECELATQSVPQWDQAHILQGMILEELGRKGAAIAAHIQACSPATFHAFPA
jgi:Flp pilus assembly protein TadD